MQLCNLMYVCLSGTNSDAQMPCSACVKTHAFAVRTHPASAPDAPDCTYDGPAAEEAQAKVAELETKIGGSLSSLRLRYLCAR
jgi:hypothetical protein